MGKLISSGNGRTKPQTKINDKKDAARHELHSLIKYCFVPRCTVSTRGSQLSFNLRLLISLLRIIHCKIHFHEEIFLNNYCFQEGIQSRKRRKKMSVGLAKYNLYFEAPVIIMSIFRKNRFSLVKVKILETLFLLCIPPLVSLLIM